MNVITLKYGLDYLKWREGSGGTVEIFDIAVTSTRRCGKGTELVNRLIAEVQGKYHLLYAFTRRTNEIAQQFYFALGFEVYAMISKFYSDGETDLDKDAIMYARRIG